MPSRENGDRFSTLNAGLENIKGQDFAAFLAWLFAAVETLKKDRENFYGSLRSRNARSINASRWAFATLGAAALLLTTLAGIAALVAHKRSGWRNGKREA